MEAPPLGAIAAAVVTATAATADGQL